MANCKGKNCKSAEYRDGLSADVKQRHEAKLSIVGGLDPYEGKLAWSDNVNILPAITYPDIVNYLLFTPSAYSADDLKAYKSLDANNQFVSGWVREKSGIVHGQYVVVTAKVLHSQRMREKPLRPWVIVEKDGKIVAAHCNCMAGLGEACTHVAALLFSIEATVKKRDSKTVTQEKAYWLLPSDSKTISYKEVNEINFVSARTAKKS
ncbi:uncharacterized protein LOC132734136 [Ruditapes philippinarum]|uniref:uncharacterized protein LOC132734136 n=1 Tax=Ruditapes philippinarum TaxID=129788 RepID=UPI00295B4C4D|nr:uncharacterized protein LOC132734136 [Ruditapes philippinarum]